MNRRLFWRITAPSLAVGLLFFGACLLSIRYIHRLQANLADVLAENVTSLQAAQELQIRVRQLRFHSLLYMLDPRPERLLPVEDDQRNFEAALDRARESAQDEDEAECVGAIETGYRAYKAEQGRLRKEYTGKPLPPIPRLMDSHPVRLVVEPCQELLRINKERMDETAAESRRVSREGYAAMIFLGLAGPVGGLVVGYGVSRALRQSLYRLSVRVQDIAEHLDRDAGTIKVVADGDINNLEEQMQVIVRHVEGVGRRLQQQQRELVRAEQLSLVGQLAAGVAHEVRNPLTGIKLLVEAARRPGASRSLGNEDLEVVHREVLRLEQTVQGFLNFARLPPPQLTPSDLGEVVRHACDLVRARAAQQGVEIVLHAPPGSVRAPVDAGQLATVLVNLFLNALDASPHGGRLEVTLEAPAGGLVRLSVCDGGTGISADVLPRLFQPFTTTKSHGTGLGLSLSRRILEEHGGSIGACNRPEGGACFILTLPAGPAGG